MYSIGHEHARKAKGPIEHACVLRYGTLLLVALIDCNVLAMII
jgi:hypothetical protein